MPTLRNRHMITESDELAKAIDEAALLWPEIKDERAELLRRIIEQGIAQVDKANAAKTARRAKAVKALAGSLDWPADWRKRQLAEWPE